MLRHLRHALRQLRQSPGFAITAILTLTLGIGASTAIFAVLDAVLLQPLPFAEPDRLVAISPQPWDSVSIPTMQDYLSRSTTLDGIAVYRQWSPKQTAVSASANRILLVNQGFFSTLGTRFAMGTGLPTTGSQGDCTGQAVVSGAYWKRLNGGSVLGNRQINLDDRNYQIIGVLPVEQAIEGNYALHQPEVFVQLGCDPGIKPSERGDADFQVFGRLRSHVTPAQAAADLARIDAALRKEYPSYYRDLGARLNKPTLVYPYIEMLVGTETRPTLLITLAACGLLLLIACSNLANLLLARNTRRRGEFAMRATLGATLSQLLRQLLVESSVLVALGAAGGMTLASLVLQLIKTGATFDLPRLSHASMRPTVAAFSIALSAAVTVCLTMLPAWRTLRPGLLRDLGGSGRASAARSLHLLGRLLVVTQLTFTTVLLACAGWMIGSVHLLLHQPLGFQPQHLLMMQDLIRTGTVQLSKTDALKAEQTFTQMAAALRQLPGVASVALTDHIPLGHSVNQYGFCSDVHPEQCRLQATPNPDSSAISPGYFSTVGQPIIEGRDFNAADDGRNPVVIVNQALAAREWPGQSAIGHRIHTGEIKPEPAAAPSSPASAVASTSHAALHKDAITWATVIGVVGDVRTHDLASAPRPDLYLPRAEDPSDFIWLIANIQGDPAALRKAVRSALKTEFPQAEVSRYETMTEEMSDEVSQRVLLMQVATVFGLVALFLSILGTYGLLAYEVSLREKEIGIRLALGSSRERIVALLVSQEGRWLITGALLGLVSAIATGYALRARFYGSQSTSLPVLFGTTFLLLGPALAAIALPATRASRLDPVQTLRRD